MTRMQPAEYHFPRVFAARNDETVVVFANGHAYGRSERREAVRQMVGMMRRDRAWAAADAAARAV